MIIPAFRAYVQTLAMATLACRNGHTAAHRLSCRTRKFTLFFLPLFPIRRTRFTVCTACGEALTLDKAPAEQLLGQALPAAPAQAPTNPVARPLSPQSDSRPAAPPLPPSRPPTSDRPRPRPTPTEIGRLGRCTRRRLERRAAR